MSEYKPNFATVRWSADVFFRSSGQRPVDDGTTSGMSVRSSARRWPDERKNTSANHRTERICDSCIISRSIDMTITQLVIVAKSLEQWLYCSRLFYILAARLGLVLEKWIAPSERKVPICHSAEWYSLSGIKWHVGHHRSKRTNCSRAYHGWDKRHQHWDINRGHCVILHVNVSW